MSFQGQVYIRNHLMFRHVGEKGDSFKKKWKIPQLFIIPVQPNRVKIMNDRINGIIGAIVSHNSTPPLGYDLRKDSNIIFFNI